MNPTKTSTDSDAFLPAGMEIEGTVKTDRPLTINGKVRGNVVSTSHVLIGDSGKVEANVQCAKLDVYGNLSGDVSAAEHVGLYKGGRMLGKITAPNLLTESGAYFKGTVEMVDGGSVTSAPKSND